MTLFTLRAHVRRSRTHTERLCSWLSQMKMLDARLLCRGSPAFSTAAAVVLLEKQQQPKQRCK